MGCSTAACAADCSTAACAADVLLVGRRGLQRTGLTFRSADESESCTLASVNWIASNEDRHEQKQEWEAHAAIARLRVATLLPDGHTAATATQIGAEPHDRVAEGCVLAAVTRVAAY